MVFASGVCLGLVGLRVLWTGNFHYTYLAWNLFLAWLPLGLALMAWQKFEQAPGRRGELAALAAIWLLFFPNAPYIFTDLVHLTARLPAHFWVDLILILSCALTGLVLGFVSLYLMQGIVKRLLGRAVSWLFIAGVAGLSGFGVWLGRFLRFNSWDVVFRPAELYHELGYRAADPLGHDMPLAFAVLFGTFLFITYLMLYALTHLRGAEAVRVANGE